MTIGRAEFFGADRSKIIAIFAGTRQEAECAVRHALTGATDLPLQVWCAEDDTALPDLQSVWPALAIVAWTGDGFAGWKLGPLVTPPFRVLVMNENGGFFPATPVWICRHLLARFQVATVSGLQRAGGDAWSLTYRSGERVRDVAKLFWSLLYRAGQRVRDVALLFFSVLCRLCERTGSGCKRAGSAALALLAFGAQGTVSLVRAVMREAGKVRGGVAACPQPVSCLQRTFIEVSLAGRGWPETAFRNAIRANVEFIVLRYEGECGDAGPLLNAACRLGAFAVAQQCAHSAWRQRVIAKHSFRPLQKDEVAEVHAPWSPLMVIRRESLERLQCPRAFTAGAALMLMFWKASASGLRSYVYGTGAGSALPDESAMALEEAEFAGRLLLKPALFHQAASGPNEIRGNIARSPGHERGFRDKPRILVVSPYLPFPLSHGGAVRIYNLCRSLSDEIDFVLACFREAGETVHYDELHEVFREVWVVDNDERSTDPTVPAQVAGYRNTAMSALIRRLCSEGQTDLVQLEYTQMAEYRDYTGAVPVLLVEHDITFELHRQIAEMTGAESSRDEFRRWREFEREALQCANSVWTMSQEDCGLAISYGASRRTIDVIPNGVDLKRFQPEPNTSSQPRVLFVGSFRHLPNLLAFERLREEIMPAVWRTCPDAVLHVIGGPDHTGAVERAGKASLLRSDARVVLEGFVTDVRPAYQQAQLVVVPLPLSAGTNIKVMEAMACGRAIVSTPAGCQGLGLEDGREVAIAGLGSCFADAIIGLLTNRTLCEHMGREARLCAERRFGWDAIAREALDSYERLVPLTRSYEGDWRNERQALLRPRKLQPLLQKPESDPTASPLP